MALPPVTSTPSIRALTGEREQRPANETPAPKSTPKPEDKVVLSEEALRRLEQDSKVLSGDEARTAASKVKEELASNAGLTLGLDQEADF